MKETKRDESGRGSVRDFFNRDDGSKTEGHFTTVAGCVTFYWCNVPFEVTGVDV